MSKLFYTPCSIFLAALVALPLAAQAQGAPEASSPARLEISAGAYDVHDDETTGEARLEYKFGTPFFWEIRPFLGVMVSGDWALYGYGGIAADVQVTDSWYIIPSFAVGAYDDGDGKDLGSTIEFRSQIGAAYEFQNGHRLGAFVSHISNAGIDDNNPGTEEVVLTYSVPVN